MTEGLFCSFFTEERMDMKNMPLSTYRKVIDALRGARLIDIYSVENSEVAAMDLMTKLLYLGLPCRHFPDSYLQQITAAGLTEADVAVGISYSGESRDMPVRGYPDLYQPGPAFLRECHFLQINPDPDRGYDLYGTDLLGL